MSDKKLKLIRLHKECGWYKAVCYNAIGGYDVEFQFLDYSKKEVIKSLRSSGVIVSREFC